MQSAIDTEAPPGLRVAAAPVPCARPAVWAYLRYLLLALTLLAIAGLLVPDAADAKRKRKRRVQPPLRILSVTISPEDYYSGDGALDITMELAIPPRTELSTILEVSVLITSSSKRYVRFLRSRKTVEELVDLEPVPDQAESDNGSDSSATTPAPAAQTTTGKRPEEFHVTLSWDGTDQNREVMLPGRYDYVIRLKLLTATKDGPRTRMVSWKKKGKLLIKEPPEEEPLDMEPGESPGEPNQPDQKPAQEEASAS